MANLPRSLGFLGAGASVQITPRPDFLWAIRRLAARPLASALTDSCSRMDTRLSNAANIEY
jgi:hypothetical protein